MGRRSRKPRPAAYVRAEQRNAEVRATLKPLDEDERPVALLAAIVLALLVGASNVVLWLAGWEVRGQDPGAGGALLPAALMVLAAWGMWRRRPWAVLGFMALLGVTILFASAGLVVASNLLAAGLCLLTIGLSGWLFWRLVRVLGRLQVPEPPR